MSEAAPSMIPAGNLVVWLGDISKAIDAGADSDVPCGDCTVCCRASQFILVTSTDVAARSVIPSELLFAAPGLPEGNHVMGYDAHGHCPMFRDSGCSIYEQRPQACRTYDCRIFAATGIDVSADGRDELAARVARWQFDLANDGAELLDALQAAGAYVASHTTELGMGAGTTGQAIAAVTRVIEA